MALRRIAREMKVPRARRRDVAPWGQFAAPRSMEYSERAIEVRRRVETGQQAPPCQTHSVTLKCAKLTYKENIRDFSASNGDTAL